MANSYGYRIGIAPCAGINGADELASLIATVACNPDDVLKTRYIYSATRPMTRLLAKGSDNRIVANAYLGFIPALVRLIREEGEQLLASVGRRICNIWLRFTRPVSGGRALLH